MGQMIVTCSVLVKEARSIFEQSPGVKLNSEHPVEVEDLDEYYHDFLDRMLAKFPQDVKVFCRFVDRLGWDAFHVFGTSLHYHKIDSEFWKFNAVQMVRVAECTSLQPGDALDLERVTPFDKTDARATTEIATYALAFRALGACLAVAMSEKDSCIVITGDTVGPPLVDFDQD